jgi:nickel transport protein
MGKPLLTAISVLAVCSVLLVISLPVAAHHVHHQVTRGEAVVVALAYGNGSPLAFDRYEIFAGDGESPYQSGKTDAQGRMVFLPDHVGIWRVKVFSEDGHGADFSFEAGPAAQEVREPDAVEPADEAAGPDEPALNTWTPEVAAAEQKNFIERYALPVAGLGIIFGLFGLFSLFVGRRR